ncbi:MAG: nicotinamide riboside transporter PnuC [Candidatus Izemoplasmataceae bacterium]
MKFFTTIKSLTLFEIALWAASVTLITGGFLISGRNGLTLIAALLGVSSLIFIAKGQPLGQLLMVFFALFYAYVSYTYDYYGEMITYLGKVLPVSLFVLITWLRHPFKEGDPEIEVSELSLKNILRVFVLAPIVTYVFYLILNAFDTPNLMVSTLSITTSFVAAAFMFLRSRYYAVFFGLNDIVLIVLWVLAAMDDIAYLPMVMLFVSFFANDTYAFINWNRIKSRQTLLRESVYTFEDLD